MIDKNIQALIVDDEEDARDILERVLMRINNINIVGKAAFADEGFEMALKLKPDIIFLDIQIFFASSPAIAKMVLDDMLVLSSGLFL